MEPLQKQNSSEQEPEKTMSQNSQNYDGNQEENEINQKNDELYSKSLGENIENDESPLKIFTENVIYPINL